MEKDAAGKPKKSERSAVIVCCVMLVGLVVYFIAINVLRALGVENIGIRYDVAVHATVAPGGGGAIKKEDVNSRRQYDAVPNDGYEFDHWGGDVDCPFPQLYFDTEERKAQYDIVAYFKKKSGASPCLIGKKSYTIRNLAVSVRQNKPVARDVSKEVMKALGEQLKGKGVNVVAANKAHDAVLRIDFQAEALGGYYTVSGYVSRDSETDNEYLYTAARLSGKATLSVNNKIVLQAAMDESSDLISFISAGNLPKGFESCVGFPDLPGEAPFAYAMKGFANDFIYAAWGPAAMIGNYDYGHQQELVKLGAKAVPYLTDALNDSDIYVRLYAIDTLRQIGKNALKAVPALVGVLRDDNYRFVYSISESYRDETTSSLVTKFPKQNYRDLSSNVNYYVHNITGEVLAAITGQDFGRDADAWEKWYRENGK